MRSSRIFVESWVAERPSERLVLYFERAMYTNLRRRWSHCHEQLLLSVLSQFIHPHHTYQNHYLLPMMNTVDYAVVVRAASEAIWSLLLDEQELGIRILPGMNPMSARESGCLLRCRTFARMPALRALMTLVMSFCSMIESTRLRFVRELDGTVPSVSRFVRAFGSNFARRSLGHSSCHIRLDWDSEIDSDSAFASRMDTVTVLCSRGDYHHCREAATSRPRSSPVLERRRVISVGNEMMRMVYFPIRLAIRKRSRPWSCS